MRNEDNFRVVKMRGTHFEMGKQYGTQCRELIRSLVRQFDGLILRENHIERGRAIVAEAVPYVREAAPELIEEVEGIAAGAGVTFDEVFKLNCSVEVFAWQGCMDAQAVSTVPEACTSFAMRTCEGTLVAWNMDWWLVWQPFIVLLQGAPKNEPRFMAFAFAGCVGRPGMSEQVAISANYLPYRSGMGQSADSQKWDGPGVPYNFLCRMMLKRESTQAAIATAVAVKRMASINYTIGDVRGDICCVETTPRDYDVLRPQGEEFIVHANSYHSPKFGGIPEAEQEKLDPRAFHARRLLRERCDKLDRYTLAAIQTTHFPGETSGICVHKKLQDKDGITLLAFIAQVGSGLMWAACGPPCQHKFREYRLPDKN